LRIDEPSASVSSERVQWDGYRAATGYWYLDTNGNGTWDGCGTDACVHWGGDPADRAIVGAW